MFFSQDDRDPLEIKPFFTFSKAQRAAIGVILVLSVAGLLSGYWLPLLMQKPLAEPEGLALYQKEIEAWTAETERLNDSIAQARAERKARYEAYKNRKQQDRSYSKYDRRNAYADRTNYWTREERTPKEVQDYSHLPMPELASLDLNAPDSLALLRLGLRPGQIRSWKNYLRKGGSLKQPVEIRKIYSLNDSVADVLLPYFKTPESNTATPALASAEVGRSADPNASPRNPNEGIQVAINEANESDLRKLRGIGPFYAEKILEYRERLGGYVSVEQLKEIRALPDSVFTKVKPYLQVGSGTIRRMPINKLSDLELSNHPYLSLKQARVLIAYRNHHGPYRTRSDVERVFILDDATIDRLMPSLDLSL